MVERAANDRVHPVLLDDAWAAVTEIFGGTPEVPGIDPDLTIAAARGAVRRIVEVAETGAHIAFATSRPASLLALYLALARLARISGGYVADDDDDSGPLRVDGRGARVGVQGLGRGARGALAGALVLGWQGDPPVVAVLCRSSMTDRALETLHLRDHDSALEAAFVPRAGMLCCSLRHRGQELLAQNAGVAAYAEHGKTMGIPLLYPWANRLDGFEYSVSGRTVNVPHDPRRVRLDAGGLPIHGVVGGRLAWEVLDAGDEDLGTGGQDAGVGDSGAIVATLSWSDAHPELFEVFPFRHELRYRARLGDGRLEIEVGVHASGEDAVPLASLQMPCKV